MTIKEQVKKIIPNKALSTYHFLLAKLAALLYNNPSNKLIVIGVTGTKGKSSTVNFISQYLEYLGYKTGLASTINFKVGEKEWLNDKKMTMLGRLQTQKLLKQMVKEGCKYAIIETSSQGIDQWRHRGINYDLVVFTNLTPEHIEAHGGFENYRAAKEKLFAHMVNSPHKTINNKKQKKIIVTNGDDQETERLKKYQADVFLTYGFEKTADIKGSGLIMQDNLVEFNIENKLIKTKLFGLVNGYNVLASLATIKGLDLDWQQASQFKLEPVPGRQEWVETNKGFRVMVDYAYEPTSLEKLHQDLKGLNFSRTISVLGGTGGGRDKARQPIMGRIAGEHSDFVIVTNDDPYDDDQQQIMDNVANGAIETGKTLNKDLFKILDRKEAIKKALSLAQANDLVLLTGKGAEQFICVADGKKIPHDDRAVVREILNKE